MTDLRRLAERMKHNSETTGGDFAAYHEATNPIAIIALLDELDGLKARVGELEGLLRRGWSLIGTLDIEQIENPEYDYADVVQKWLDNTDSALENKDE